MAHSAKSGLAVRNRSGASVGPAVWLEALPYRGRRAVVFAPSADLRERVVAAIQAKALYGGSTALRGQPSRRPELAGDPSVEGSDIGQIYE